MVSGSLSRRGVLIGVSMTLLGAMARAEPVRDLAWRDLLPEGDMSPPGEIRSLLPHDESAMAARQPPSSGVRYDWNGQIVRMSGYVVPLEYRGTGITEFILVPYVGACIHVPPPPANQLVFVTTETPYDVSGLFDPVTVTGVFGTASRTTQLAEIGYVLAGAEIRRFG